MHQFSVSYSLHQQGGFSPSYHVTQSLIWLWPTPGPDSYSWQYPGVYMKSVRIKFKNKQITKWRHSQSRGVIDFSAYGFLLLFGMHNRKNSCGWENNYNKYCSKQYLLLLEITKCHAFLSPTVLLCTPNGFTVKGH